jgi:hypothetical protein
VCRTAADPLVLSVNVRVAYMGSRWDRYSVSHSPIGPAAVLYRGHDWGVGPKVSGAGVWPLDMSGARISHEEVPVRGSGGVTLMGQTPPTTGEAGTSPTRQSLSGVLAVVSAVVLGIAAITSCTSSVS